MDPPGRAGRQCPWRPWLAGLLLQLLLAVCFFSYQRVSHDGRTGAPGPGLVALESVPERPAGATSTTGSRCQATPGAPARPALLILLWTWPFHIPVSLSRCSEMLPGAADCHLTADRSVYPRAHGVIVHHWDVMFNPKAQLPRSPRPPGQRWVWFNMEPPLKALHLQAMDGHFNLTMSYRSDSDIFMPYGWLEPWPGQPAHAMVNLSAKTELAAWVVSGWRPDSARVRYYEALRAHLQVDVYGKQHRPLPRDGMARQLARYKFYLAFENSRHRDYITEKLWRNAMDAWAVPVVLGPSRANYEQFLPPDAFIHVDDFQSPRDLARYLQALDKDPARYLAYFRWREALRPRSFSWALAFCKACWQLQQEPRYHTVPGLAAWFTSGASEPGASWPGTSPAGTSRVGLQPTGA
ncbi:3-galactosyl-N-acetylglucosaminide 4-alpha-L-fucosyltransferase FUT3-like [Microcebus murinus]|uniref:3-galactosyl-N-acetylglucosaminide 4-alpha-L-fucosyltransferase FUT3-like n=1 Tax=Microcebus murinus TaxID=30608 RepID=UPI003F6B94C0